MSQFTEVNGTNLTWLKEQSTEVETEIIQSRLSLCQIIANQIMEEEMIRMAGEVQLRKAK